jgi:hypothetical protein
MEPKVQIPGGVGRLVANGDTVVITLWQDQLSLQGDKIVYDDTGASQAAWRKSPASNERLENLKWARDHCYGRFRTLVTVAADTNATPRSIAACYLQPELWMKLTSLMKLPVNFARWELLQRGIQVSWGCPMASV